MSRYLKSKDGITVPNRKIVSQRLYWSYASLAMYEMARKKGKEKYDGECYGLRTKLYNDLLNGAKSPRSIYYDERDKLSKADECAYCGKKCEPAVLTLDHLFPRARGGEDSGNNLVYCCRGCNSSKGKQDLMVWLYKSDRQAPVSTMRRYLKNAICYCNEHELMDKNNL